MCWVWIELQDPHPGAFICYIMFKLSTKERIRIKGRNFDPFEFDCPKKKGVLPDMLIQQDERNCLQSLRIQKWMLLHCRRVMAPFQRAGKSLVKYPPLISQW